MKTHNALKILLIITFTTFSFPSKSDVEMDMPSKAAPVVSTVSNTNSENANSEYAQKLINRLEEIKAMDMDKMSKAEKQQLRKEVRSIKKELAAIGGGVYLSVGAIIIIILLLILLL